MRGSDDSNRVAENPTMQELLLNSTNKNLRDHDEDDDDDDDDDENEVWEGVKQPALVVDSHSKKRRRRRSRKKQEKDPVYKAVLECARMKFWPVVPFVQDRHLNWNGKACNVVLKYCGYENLEDRARKTFWEEKARTLLKRAMAQLRNGAVQRSKESLKAYYTSK